MKDFEKEIEKIEISISEKEFLDVVQQSDEIYELSHGSHSQHSSSSR